MSSIRFDEASAACDAVGILQDKIGAVDIDALSVAEHRELLARVEAMGRRLPALQHPLINSLAEHATVAELGGSVRNALADALRITRGEAARRIEEAADLGPRRALTGEPLAPRLEATAAGQAAGEISAAHVKEIRGFFARLPYWVDEPTRVEAERQLAQVAASYRPDQLKGFAEDLDLRLNPDGNYSDQDRARRRGLTLGPQGPDGMSRICGQVTPEVRAGLDAAFAKWAAPGMCNPADEHPTIEGAPSEEAVVGDVRSAAMRNHDALNMMARSTLMSGQLSSHQGLPVTIVATAKLEDLQAETGMATTATGTRLPIKDVIRMGAHANNYLLLFDNAKRCRLYMGRPTRLATAAQRLVLYATERGCTRPGCTVPAAWCQVHHVKSFAKGGPTTMDNLTLACGPASTASPTTTAGPPTKPTKAKPSGSRRHISPPADPASTPTGTPNNCSETTGTKKTKSRPSWRGPARDPPGQSQPADLLRRITLLIRRWFGCAVLCPMRQAVAHEWLSQAVDGHGEHHRGADDESRCGSCGCRHLHSRTVRF